MILGKWKTHELNKKYINISCLADARVVQQWGVKASFKRGRIIEVE